MLPDLLHLRVLEAASVTIGRGWNARDVRSPYWRIYANSRDGAEVILAGGRRWPLPAGHVHVIPAWVGFTCRAVGEIGHLYAHVETLGLPGPLVREHFPRPVTIGLDAVLAAQTDRLPEALATVTPTGACRVQAWAFEVVARVLDGLPAPLQRRLMAGSAPDLPLLDARRLIDDRLDRPVDNAELAAACGLSSDHFIRRFRLAYGQTPAQFVLERRLAAAARRLVLGSEPIPVIAASCGFPDRFYFSRVFARRLGLPPAAYRARGQV